MRGMPVYQNLFKMSKPLPMTENKQVYVQVEDLISPGLENTNSLNGGIKWESNPAYDLNNKLPPPTFNGFSGILMEENTDDYVKSYDFSVQKVKEWQENNPIYDSLPDPEIQHNKNTAVSSILNNLHIIVFL